MKRTPLQRKTPLTSGGTRRKRCPACRVMFTPVRASQAVCGEIECAIAHGQSEKGQASARKALADVERREIKVRKARLKSRADHLREAQAVFNEWVRLRDADLPCISCGRHHDGQYHAGHYRTVGANPEIRFEPLNVWKQCAPCNTHLSGNLVNYRLSLLQRIGAEKLGWLEGPHPARKYTIEEIKAIKADYREKIKEMKKGIAA
ncbi:recombination protein NinG [Pseudomonas protegens]|uniref:Protein NinG n=1 Tax=Pseudomonas protegens (strain DSM 19095 / LMG 27888 / CFBP 6595 / CHA0) TaxID=1124983 RepID=A0A2C9EPL0_PSEPH|nr:recombination protein NinG [Pseudomonas protegens]AGL85585.1 protein NinG [Pseudomonas protegens CHA0]MBP5112611.1 recombination protein NinG [Pseudomonas protegens]QTU23027.1 recombination protein NinG [Pseudomonas protegens]QTU32558.1 recombination protein NinG [Pseudomonas protegens]RLO19791.1 recombination protein NinG [Pseudomonas protegens]